MSEIDRFRGKYHFLSNFYIATVTDPEGKVWPTAEHAYQACKTWNVFDREQIQKAATPGQAKRLGARAEIRAHWEDVKFSAMEKVVTAKFEQHPDLMEKLLATGDRSLVEGNTWGDKYWGISGGEGQNRLGKILMHIRDGARE